MFVLLTLSIGSKKRNQWRIQDFSDRGINSRVWGKNLLFSKIFVKKLHENEIETRGGARP